MKVLAIPHLDHTQALMDRLLLSRDQVAEVLGVDSATIETLHRNGTLRGRRVGKELHWRPEWVRMFVEELVQDD